MAIQAMNELIREALALPNLPLTALLGMMLVYWLLVLVGTLDFDFDLFDLGGDAAAGDMPGDHGGALGGAMLTAGRLFGFHQVPIAIWGSFFILFLWSGSMILNYRFNGADGAHALGTAGWLLLPNVLGSLLFTKITTLPVARLFGALSKVDDECRSPERQNGFVTTMELDDRYGQVQVNQSGAPLLINARLRQPGSLRKGDAVRVLEPSADGHFYFVEPLPPSPSPSHSTPTLNP